MPTLRIGLVIGSLRAGSFNRQLADAVRTLAGDRFVFEEIGIGDLPLYDQDDDAAFPAAGLRFKQQVEACDALLFVTPEYNHSFPAPLKNLIDWLSRPISDQEPQVLAGKPTAISGISPAMTGTSMAQDHLVTLISFLNMDVMNVPRLTIPNAMQQLDSDGKLTLKASYPYFEKQANAFLSFITKRIQ